MLSSPRAKARSGLSLPEDQPGLRPLTISVIAATVGLVVTAISLLGNWVRPYWLDEAATLRAARVNGDTLLSFLSHLDAVHGFYYMGIHAWIELFGESEFSVRAVSGLAAGLGAAGIVVLCAQFRRIHVGVVAAIIFPFLPRIVQMSAEGRSYAMSAAFVVWGIVALVNAARRNRWWAWALYVVVVVTGTYMFLYSVLILAVHLAYVLVMYAWSQVLRRFIISAIIIVALVSPVVYLAYGQKGQISWISNSERDPFQAFVVAPTFASHLVFASVAGLLIVLYLLALMKSSRRDERPLAIVIAAWIVLPTALLGLADAAVGSLYVARYLTFTTPAMAILLGLSIYSFRARWLRVVALVVVLAVSIPGFVAARSNEGGAASDYRAIADAVSAHACEGDAIWLQEDGDIAKRPRWSIYAYPDRYQGLNDIAFVKSGMKDGTLRDYTRKIEDVGAKVKYEDRIWLVTTKAKTEKGAAMHAELTRLGLATGDVIFTGTSVITEYLNHGATPANCYTESR